MRVFFGYRFGMVASLTGELSFGACGELELHIWKFFSNTSYSTVEKMEYFKGSFFLWKYTIFILIGISVHDSESVYLFLLFIMHYANIHNTYLEMVWNLKV